MNEREELDERLRGLPAPQQRAEQVERIRQRARQRFVERGSRQRQRAQRRRFLGVIEPALLALITLAYLSWTALTLVRIENAPDRIVPAAWRLR
jgi:hypothetical protein